MTNPTEAPEPTEPTEASVTPEATTIDPATPAARHFRRTRAFFAPVSRVLGKIPHPPWHSKRGVLVLLLLIGGVGTVVGVGGMTAISFSETPGFCGMCHTMDPELK